MSDPPGYFRASRRRLKSLQSPLVRVDRDQPLPLSWAQQRLWFLANLDAESVAYHVLGALRLSGELVVEALEFALDTLIERHEVLRTLFEETPSGVVQVILPERRFGLERVDLTSLDSAEQWHGDSL